MAGHCDSNSSERRRKLFGFGTCNGRRKPSARARLYLTQCVVKLFLGSAPRSLSTRLAKPSVENGGGNSRGKYPRLKRDTAVSCLLGKVGHPKVKGCAEYYTCTDLARLAVPFPSHRSWAAYTLSRLVGGRSSLATRSSIFGLALRRVGQSAGWADHCDTPAASRPSFSESPGRVLETFPRPAGNTPCERDRR